MIRPYTPADKAQLLYLLRLNIPTYFAPEEESDFAGYLEKEVEDYFVVEEAGELLGAGGVNYFPEEGVARISWDVIHPNHQGKGIGSRLLQHRINILKAKPGINTVIVRTTQLVYRFYEKQGFALEKTEKDFWAKGFDLYQLRLPLTKV
ncbi:N-acetylglutamate synthase-like GNAT family acetyltransferase [Pontibacter mucosus]|uniref:N-acetylglutamate synthase-like GNAT family acetyltransferase n=1 Tax=Pontibacter mucosus TaxID=1649266 RepID=A0A2T5YTT8_9BACT|nr:GNAT family N-acetyltransferase [Pontibacter mucosus]PTX22732.1 N-acetylglutamate synthase-like GNAT family acetyltransferase [Pontibacter mucosus]